MISNKFREIIGKRIKSLLVAQDKTAKELASFLGMSQSNVSMILSGETNLTIDSAKGVAQFFNISLDDLLSDDPNIFLRDGDARIRELIREEAIKIIEEKLKEREEEK